MEALFPYLLPYLILTSWLIRITTTSSSTSYFTFFQTYFISAIGGFPTGAATITQLTKQQVFTKRQAALMLGICHSPSPLFLFGFVGQDLLQSTTFSWQYLLLIHSFSLCLLLVVYRLVAKDGVQTVAPIKETTPFSNSIRDSAPTILTVAITLIFLQPFIMLSFIVLNRLLASHCIQAIYSWHLRNDEWTSDASTASVWKVAPIF